MKCSLFNSLSGLEYDAEDEGEEKPKFENLRNLSDLDLFYNIFNIFLGNLYDLYGRVPIILNF